MWLARLFDGRPDSRPRQPHPWARLCRILRREKELADGFKGGFSLLVLAVGSARLAPLLKVLQQRLRYSDEAGWLNEEHTQIGVVMHRTPGWGAWKVADDLCAALPAGAPQPACEVYYYPLQPADDKNHREDPAHGLPESPRAVKEMGPLLAKAMPPPRAEEARREENVAT
jgi:hypothetical protein